MSARNSLRVFLGCLGVFWLISFFAFLTFCLWLFVFVFYFLRVLRFAFDFMSLRLLSVLTFYHLTFIPFDFLLLIFCLLTFFHFTFCPVTLLTFFGFELDGGSFWPWRPPWPFDSATTMAKVAETATRARVKHSSKLVLTINPRLAGGGGRYTPPLFPPSYNYGLARLRRAKLWVAVTNWMDHLRIKFQKYQTENFGAFNVLMTSLHAISDPKVAIVRESIKGKPLNGNACKTQVRRKMTSSTRWLSRIFDILWFRRPKFQKHLFVFEWTKMTIKSKILKKRIMC